MLDMLLNSKAAAGSLAAAFAPDPGNATSGGDFRAFSGAGAGWTVATGKASASGARMSDPATAAYGAGLPDAQLASQAGSSPLLLLALGSLALGMLLRKRG